MTSLVMNNNLSILYVCLNRCVIRGYDNNGKIALLTNYRYLNIVNTSSIMIAKSVIPDLVTGLNAVNVFCSQI